MSNKGDSHAFRNEVLLALHAAGLTTARKPQEPKGIPVSGRVRGDIVGLPVTIAVRNTQALDLSGGLREAQREAQAENHDIYVTVQSRRGHPTQDSYVITDLGTWLRIMTRLHPEVVNPR